MEKFLNTLLHYGRKSMIDIENTKYIVEQEIKNVISRVYITFYLTKINVFLGHFIFIRKMENFMLMVEMIGHI